ncbi:MAG: patatin-like phospholipase family protein [Pseudomonadota bacterium]
MGPPQHYKRCLVMAGGGFRLGIYLGMHAAACEAGRAPEVVLASCGGAIAAALVHSVTDPLAQKAWLASPEMHRFWCSIRPAAGAAIHRALWGAARRALTRQPAPRIPDVFTDHLFELPQGLPALPAPGQPTGPDVALVGSRLLFTEAEVGQLRGTRKLFEEVVFCGPRAAGLLQGMPSPFNHPRWGNTAVAPEVAVDTAMPLDEAVRVSVTDMYYFTSHRRGAQHYLGGVVDLFPIEVAHRLAEEVAIEFKAPFDQGASVPAWRAVLGVDANQRLRHVHAQRADVWIDSSDVGTVLGGQRFRREFAWRQNRLRLAPPTDYAQYVSHIEAQWRYGHQRAREAYARAATAPRPSMRLANRFNLAPGG